MARERLIFPLSDFSYLHALPEYMMIRGAYIIHVFFLCLLRFPYKNDVRLVTLISLVILLIALDHVGICLASYPMCTR